MYIILLTCDSDISNCWPKRLRWSRGSVLAFGTQVRGFKPGRSRRIFRGEKILSTPSFGREVKPWVPCLTACKRTLNVPSQTAFRQNLSAMFLAHVVVPFFAARGLSDNTGRGCGPAAQRDLLEHYWGSTISLYGCGTSGAYALGPD